jgi:hypothetical protein
MTHYLMGNARPPFTDWLAQVERIATRHSRSPVTIDQRFRAVFQSYYDVGLSPHEAATDLLQD